MPISRAKFNAGTPITGNTRSSTGNILTLLSTLVLNIEGKYKPVTDHGYKQKEFEPNPLYKEGGVGKAKNKKNAYFVAYKGQVHKFIANKAQPEGEEVEAPNYPAYTLFELCDLMSIKHKDIRAVTSKLSPHIKEGGTGYINIVPIDGVTVYGLSPAGIKEANK